MAYLLRLVITFLKVEIFNFITFGVCKKLPILLWDYATRMFTQGEEVCQQARRPVSLLDSQVIAFD